MRAYEASFLLILALSLKGNRALLPRGVVFVQVVAALALAFGVVLAVRVVAGRDLLAWTDSFGLHSLLLDGLRWTLQQYLYYLR